MGSGGTEWDATDNPEKARLNQKTTYVGTGSGINALSPTYPGQLAFCTSTGSGFTQDHVYVRNAANDAWSDYALSNIQVATEESSTPVTDNADFTVAAGRRYFQFITLPSTYPLYRITGIEWKNGASVSGTVMSGIELVESSTPASDPNPIVCVGAKVTQTGTSVVQRESRINGIFPGGTLLAVYITFSANTTCREINTGTYYQKATTYIDPPELIDGTNWGTSTGGKYIKLYYQGFW